MQDVVCSGHGWGAAVHREAIARSQAAHYFSPRRAILRNCTRVPGAPDEPAQGAKRLVLAQTPEALAALAREALKSILVLGDLAVLGALNIAARSLLSACKCGPNFRKAWPEAVRTRTR
jgi:hypothetical protein